MCGNRAQNSNTRPKLFEASYGRTSQHNEDLLAMSSPAVLHSAFYAVLQALRTLKRRWLPDLRCRISDSQPTPLNQPPGTTTKKDEDEDRLTMGTSEPAALLRVADDNRE